MSGGLSESLSLLRIASQVSGETPKLWIQQILSSQNCLWRVVGSILYAVGCALTLGGLYGFDLHCRDHRIELLNEAHDRAVQARRKGRLKRRTKSAEKIAGEVERENRVIGKELTKSSELPKQVRKLEVELLSGDNELANEKKKIGEAEDTKEDAKLRKKSKRFEAKSEEEKKAYNKIIAENVAAIKSSLGKNAKDDKVEEFSDNGKNAIRKVYKKMDELKTKQWNLKTFIAGLSYSEMLSAVRIAAGGIKEVFKVIAFLFSSQENVELISSIFDDEDKVINVSRKLFDHFRKWKNDAKRQDQYQYIARLANTIGLTDDQLYEVNRKIEAGHAVLAVELRCFNTAYAPFMKTLLNFQKQKFRIGRSK